MEQVLQAIAQGQGRYIEELKELMRIPSVSSAPDRASDVRRASEWMKNHFQSMGLEARVCETARHPVVYAEWLGAPGKPTILFYGHCDVQPVEPLEAWDVPPFEPVEKDGNILGRGASDDKGQLFTHVKGVEAWLKTTGRLPVNVKFLIEAEEEVGSPNLPAWIDANRQLVAADVVVISDTAQFAPGLPSLCTGLRGIAAFEIHVKTSDTDLHSGSFGGAVPNAVMALTTILNGLHETDGRVSVRGFYDDVVEPSAEEKRSWKQLPHSDQEFLKTAGAQCAWGEPGRTTLERIWSRPTIEVVGITGGFQGPGHKGIVPGQAVARCSARLVPDQKPEQVVDCIRQRVMSLAPKGAHVEFKGGHGSPPVSIPTDSRWVASAVAALERGFGRKPVFIREGGSISIVTRFVADLKIPCLLLGFGLNDDRIHAPNEKFSVTDFMSGIRTSAALLDELGAGASG